MSIDAALIQVATGLHVAEPVDCDALGLVSDRFGTRLLTFLDDSQYGEELVNNSAIAAAFVLEAMADEVRRHGRVAVVCDDPRFHFYTLRNYIARRDYTVRPSSIDPTARIHPRAFVADYNVTIGPECLVEPNATILADVTLGRGCVIRASAVLGSEGFEFKRTLRGILPVFHDGDVRLGDYVDIGANTCVDKGFSWRSTLIGNGTKVDNLVHIAHGAQLGERCLVVACAMVAGSVNVGDEVWIGPNANVSSGLSVGGRAFVTLGSVVTKNVPAGEHVTGTFAIAHQRFLRHLKRIVTE
jgi:UDP-3-O-[3-hydroxymyristoyl] glucosamine N-acyltransferase